MHFLASKISVAVYRLKWSEKYPVLQVSIGNGVRLPSGGLIACLEAMALK